MSTFFLANSLLNTGFLSVLSIKQNTVSIIYFPFPLLTNWSTKQALREYCMIVTTLQYRNVNMSGELHYRYVNMSGEVPVACLIAGPLGVHACSLM